MRSKSTAAKPSEEKAPVFIAGARGLAGAGPLALIERTIEKQPAMKPGLY